MWKDRGFPLPSGRGFVEAEKEQNKPDGCPQGFPLPSGRGFVEAARMASKSLTIFAFPLPSGRGFVEAMPIPNR